MKKMQIPSKAFWDWKEFVASRFAQHVAAKKHLEANPNPAMILVEPDFDVLCDFCAVDIPNDGQLVNLVDYGRRVVCDGCYQKHYAKEEIVYKTIEVPDVK